MPHDLGKLDLGKPVAYLALEEGTPVYDPDCDRIGVVETVVADVPEDIFRGIVFHTVPLPGRHLYADADQIAGLYERGVVLAVGRDALQEPKRQPDTREHAGGTASVEKPLEARLRRAWDWITNRAATVRRPGSRPGVPLLVRASSLLRNETNGKDLAMTSPSFDDETSGADSPSPEEVAKQTAVLRNLADSVAFIPHAVAPEATEQPDGAISLPVIERAGQQFIPVFTSLDSLRAAGLDANTTLRIPLAELAANWPSDDVWLAVNPAGEDGIGLPTEVVRMLPLFAGPNGGAPGNPS